MLGKETTEMWKFVPPPKICINRHLDLQIASRTVLAGELVLAESPIVVGPNQVENIFLVESLIVFGVLCFTA